MSMKELATALSATDALLSTATMDDVVEALRITTLMLAVHEQDHGEVPIEKIFDVLQTDELDEETADLLVKGFQNLAGVLGSVIEVERDEGVVH
ncbi:MAG TPA: hypothetical protein HPP91_09970 [Gammaproteobacteria bacterium]|nr:hypothetical protein [Gammaproteobacteria bacterium]HIJ28841.1 hypothetical protein [Gammaproteobacteria bacterium]